MTEQKTPSTPDVAGPAASQHSHAVAGPLTIRDVAVLGSVALIFLASLLPIIATVAGSFNLWNVAGLFYLGIGVILPLAVGVLFLIRRLSPQGTIRIGSLSVDQLASVVASFATFFFFTATVTSFSVAYLLGLLGALALLTATVGAQWVPVLAADFAGRTEVPAHVVARDAVAAIKRSAAPKPVVADGDVSSAKQFGHKTKTQPSSTGRDVGVAGASAQAAAQPSGWNAEQAAVGHTAAGQIFTPAKESSVAAGAAVTTKAAAASGTEVKAAATTTAATASGTGAKGAATASNSAADTAVRSAAQATSPETLHTSTLASADTDVKVGAETATVAGAVVSAKDASATSLNPQVAESSVTNPVRESIGATVHHKTPAVVADPFWFAVDRPQNVIDEKTRQFVFKLTPGSWILALEDRGSSFLVQDSHGKTGILLDLVGIERASDSQ